MSASAFSTLPELAQRALEKLSHELAGVRPVEEDSWLFRVSELPGDDEGPKFLAAVKKWANNSKLCLYYFECVPSECRIDLEKVETLFKDAKSHESNNRAYARLNKASMCLYVGSSQSICKRLAEHLGYGASGTYALQLLHWARPLDLQLRFVCARYPDNTDYSVVQALEDALWSCKAPMFGRQGRK